MPLTPPAYRPYLPKPATTGATPTPYNPGSTTYQPTAPNTGQQTGAATSPGAAPSAPSTAAALTPHTTTPAPTANGALGTDPQMMEFLRSMGLSQADAEAAAQQATAAVGARLTNNLNQLGFQGGLARTRIAAGEESRGMLRSGESLRNVAIQRAEEGQREEALRQAAASQLAQIMTNLGLQHQQGAVQASELGLSRSPAIDVANQLAALGIT